MGEAMRFFDPPPLKYMGSKWQLADWIIENFPPHYTYVEPYCGGAAVFFRKHAAEIEVLNDLNGDVLNFFAMLRTRTDDFVRLVDLTPYSREEFEQSFVKSDDPLERARRFYVRSWQAFGSGGISEPTGWRCNRNPSRGATPMTDWNRLHGLFVAARRLKEAALESDQALKVIARYDTSDTLFYVDPPYVMETRERKGRRYVHEMTADDHRALAECLHQIQGMALLSGYMSDLYAELYADWRVLSKSTTTNGNSTATEYLWISPNANNLNRWPLFEER